MDGSKAPCVRSLLTDASFILGLIVHKLVHAWKGRFPITITNAESVSQSYYRTLLEAGTLRGYFQHQFIIVDTDFNGVEDQFE